MTATNTKKGNGKGAAARDREDITEYELDGDEGELQEYKPPPSDLIAERKAEMALNERLRGIECYMCGRRGPYTVTKTWDRKKTGDTRRTIICRACGYGNAVIEVNDKIERAPDGDQKVPPHGWPTGTKRHQEEERKAAAKATGESLLNALLTDEFMDRHAELTAEKLLAKLKNNGKKAVASAADDKDDKSES